MPSRRLKRALIYTGLGLVVLMAGLTTWSNWPIYTDSDEPGQAVELANAIGDAENPYREGYAGSHGKRIHYVTAGKGDPVILVHGFPSYWFSMFGLMEALKDDYQVIAIDGLGVGRSDAPGSVDAYGIEHLVGAITTVADEMGLKRLNLVGHDWGVALVTGFAQAYPERVKSLTAMSALPHNIVLSRVAQDEKHKELFSYTAYFARANPLLIKILGVKQQIWQDIYAPFVEQGLISKAEGEQFRDDVGNPRRLNRFINWYRANFGDLDDINEEDFWPAKNARLLAPAIFIYGDKDPVVTDEMVDDFRSLSDSLSVTELKDVGHRPHIEQEAVVVAAIRELIESAR